MNRLFLFLLFQLLISSSCLYGQDNTEIESNQFYIKADLLSPTLTIITPENDFIAGVSFEYKMKFPWSIQLNGNYYQEKPYVSKVGFQIILEGRYFIKSHHFTGLYLKFDQTDYSNYPPTYNTYYNQKLGFGALYGYQRIINRWVFEGRIGFGINKEARITGIFGNDQFEFADSKMKIDNILAFNIGYRIF